MKSTKLSAPNGSPWHSSVERAVSPGSGVGILPSNRLMGMCRWLGSHFQGWIDYNGVAFLLEILEGIAHFQDLGDQKIQVGKDFYFVMFNQCVN